MGRDGIQSRVATAFGIAALAAALLGLSGCDDDARDECKSLIAALTAIQPQHLSVGPTFDKTSFLSAQYSLLAQRHVKAPARVPEPSLKQCMSTLRLLQKEAPTTRLRDFTLDLMTSYTHQWDPHSDTISQRAIDTLGGFSRGFGFDIERDDETGRVEIVDVIAGSPADEAGLREGMSIWTLDKRYVRQISTAELHALVRNEKAATLTVGVVGATTTSGPQSYQEVVISHGEFEASPVKLGNFSVRISETDYSVGYIKLRGFTGAQAFFAEALKTLKSSEALILDLRGISGGEIQAAADLASLLHLKGDVFVGLRSRAGDVNEIVHLRAGSSHFDGPLVVLVDATTKSSAEILAGALQDYGALVVGSRTFGKGTRQTLVSLAPYGLSGGLLLTDAFTVRPSGRLIQARGIEPDLEVPIVGRPRYEENYPHALARPDDLPAVAGYDPKVVPVQSPFLQGGLSALRAELASAADAPSQGSNTQTDRMFTAAKRAAVLLIQTREAEAGLRDPGIELPQQH